MLFVNLGANHEISNRRRTLTLAAFGFFLVGITSVAGWWFTRLEPRSLFPEEREAVFHSLQRLEQRVPEISQWSRATLADLESNRLEMLLASTSAPLEWDEEGLVFSPEFFEEESLTQERILLDLVVEKYARAHFEAPEVVIGVE